MICSTKSRLRFCCFAVISFFFALLSTPSYAATITTSEKTFCAFALEGNIVDGDSGRLSLLVATSAAQISGLNERSGSICLSSNGGSYSEGLKIAEIIFGRGLSTVVESGARCFSACALIFMAGVVPEQVAPLRKLSANGVIGFHAPYINLPDQNYSKEDIEGASQAMRFAILKLLELSAKKTQLGGEFLKKSFIHRILEKGPTEAFFVKTISEAARWDIVIYDAWDYYKKLRPTEELKNLCTNFHYANMDENPPSNSSLTLRVENYDSKFTKGNFRVFVAAGTNPDPVCEIYPRTFKSDDRPKFYACSYDYWTNKNFGNCRNYKTDPFILVGKFVPDFLGLSPQTPLRSFLK